MPSGISKPKKIMVKLTSGGKSPLIVQKGSQVEKAVELLIRGHTRKFIEEHKGIPRNIIWHARQRLDKIGAHIPTKAVHRTMLLKATPESARGALRLYNADLSSKQVGQLAGINARLARKLDTTHRALKRHEARHLA
ncbi:hypothetical protein KKH30_03410, partial [Candidatus Micrarchaeota archaeon]|nr:hypothetical protein [Candidatus Micrarchaeota archaeon]MBU1939785.1 hypothetical protein [Candidatus Micrarchaeota archaeon]